jgi:hypothetical protein
VASSYQIKQSHADVSVAIDGGMMERAAPVYIATIDPVPVRTEKQHGGKIAIARSCAVSN